MSSFKGSSKCLISQGDIQVEKVFRITKASTANSNDGFIASNRTVSDVHVEAYSEDGTSITALMIDSTSVVITATGASVTLQLSHPGADWSDQKVTLKFRIVMDVGEVIAYFNRVFISLSEVGND